jgi:hypothetical protein
MQSVGAFRSTFERQGPYRLGESEQRWARAIRLQACASQRRRPTRSPRCMSLSHSAFKAGRYPEQSIYYRSPLRSTFLEAVVGVGRP